MPLFQETDVDGWNFNYYAQLNAGSETATPTQYSSFSFYVLNFGGGYSRTSYTGSNLTYSGPNMGQYIVIGGTISNVLYTNGGGILDTVHHYGLSIDDASYDASVIGTLMNAGDRGAQLWNYLAAGNDTFIVGNGADTVYAADGNDLVYVAGTGDKVIVGGQGQNTIIAGSGNDYIYAGHYYETPQTAGWSYADGGAGNDVIYAGYGTNGYLLGGDGNDVLVDGLGTDVLRPGRGNDYVAAFNGTNILYFTSDSYLAGELDVVGNFAGANNYIELTNGWQPYVSVQDHLSGALISMPGADASGHFGTGNYYIYVDGVNAAYVTSHLYYD